MKSVFVNCLGDETKVEKLVKIANAIFDNEDLKSYVAYSKDISLEENLILILNECDYYINDERVYSEESKDQSTLDRIAHDYFAPNHRFCIPEVFLYSEEDIRAYHEKVDKLWARCDRL